MNQESRYFIVNSCSIGVHDERTDDMTVKLTFDKLCENYIDQGHYFPYTEKLKINEKYGIIDFSDPYSEEVKSYNKEMYDIDKYAAERSLFIKRIKEVIKNTDQGYFIFCGHDFMLNTDCCKLFIYVGKKDEQIRFNKEDNDIMRKLFNGKIPFNDGDIFVYRKN